LYLGMIHGSLGNDLMDTKYTTFFLHSTPVVCIIGRLNYQAHTTPHVLLPSPFLQIPIPTYLSITARKPQLRGTIEIPRPSS